MSFAAPAPLQRPLGQRRVEAADDLLIALSSEALCALGLFLGFLVSLLDAESLGAVCALLGLVCGCGVCQTGGIGDGFGLGLIGRLFC